LKDRKKVYKNELPAGYSCPLCPEHEDDEFYRNHVLDMYVCEGCEWEISYVLSQEEGEEGFLRNDRDLTFDWMREQLQHLAGKKFSELRKIFQQQESILDEAIFIHVNGGEE
jgi:hypothetical protein